MKAIRTNRGDPQFSAPLARAFLSSSRHSLSWGKKAVLPGGGAGGRHQRAPG